MKRISDETAAAFAAKVSRSLHDLRLRYEKALAEGSPRPKLSMKSFVENYGITRSVLYDSYKTEKARIEVVFSELAALAISTQTIKKKPSITSLQAEVITLRKELKRLTSTYAAITMNDLYSQYGDAFRDTQHLTLKYQECLRENADLKHRLNNYISTVNRTKILKNNGSS